MASKKNILKERCIKNCYTNMSSDTLCVDSLLDYKEICDGDILEDISIISRSKVHDNIFREVVTFILNSDNVKTFSWSVITKTLANYETIVLPKLQTTKCSSQLRGIYHELMMTDNSNRECKIYMSMSIVCVCAYRRACRLVLN